jgi:hypothetical protein
VLEKTVQTLKLEVYEILCVLVLTSACEGLLNFKKKKNKKTLWETFVCILGPAVQGFSKRKLTMNIFMGHVLGRLCACKQIAPQFWVC